MQVFKNYFKILKSHKLSLMIYLVIFILMIIFFGLARKGDTEKNFEDVDLYFTFINNDKDTELVQGLFEYLDERYTFVEMENNIDDLKDSLFFHEITHVIIIPEGFTDAFIKGDDVSIEEMTFPDSNYADFGNIIINNYLSTARTFFSLYPEYDTTKILELVNNSLLTDINVSLSTDMEETGTYSFMTTYHNFFVYILLAVFTSIICIIMSSYQNLDMKRRNISSPISLKSMQLQLFLGNIIFALIATTILIIIGFIINGSFIINLSIILFWINAYVFALCATSISFLISQFTLPKEASIALSNILSLGLAFMSGGLVPQFLLGDGLLKVSRFLPTYWFVLVNETISQTAITNEVLLKIFSYIGIVAVYTLALFAISIAIAKANNRKEA